MADLPQKPALPLVWRAYAVLDGEGPRQFLEQYAKLANETLEAISRDVSDETQKQALNEIRMFLRGLEQALAPAGYTRLTLVLQKRRGRPRKSRDEVRRGMTAAYMVERLVADGWKQEAAVAKIGDQMGIGRTELFKWMKRSREFVEL